MTGWQALAGGSMRCQAGHTGHASQSVEIVLDGPTAVPDFPSIPREHSCEWTMHVWDTEHYMGQHGVYCTGQDEASLSIASQGVWEGFETLLALELLDMSDKDGIVVDIGAHVGWYTMLSVVCRRRVVAIEADPENVQLLAHNSFGRGVETVHGWIGEATPPVDIDEQVRLVKVDIEGLEREAIRVLKPMLRRQAIDWLMLELTPAFPGSDCGGIVRALNNLGYGTYLVPTKGDPLAGTVCATALCAPLTPSQAAGLPEQRTLLARAER